MSVPTQCPSCSRRFAAPDHLLGKGVKCPQCATQFVVHAAPTAPAAAIQARPSAPVQSAAPPSVMPPVDDGVRKLPVKNILIGVAALCLMLGFIYGAFALLSGAAGWREYNSKDGGFVVLMPGSPTPMAKTDPKITGVKAAAFAALPIQEVALPAGAATFSVQYFDYPHQPISPALSLSYLKNHLLSEKAGSTLTHEQDLKLGEYAGKEVVVETGSQAVARRIFLANARVYSVTAQYPKSEGGYPTEVQRFFESFKITQPPPMPTVTLAALSAPAAGTAPPTTKIDTPKDPPIAKTDPTPKAGFPLNPDEQEVLKLMNEERAALNLRPLTPSQRLFEGSRSEAESQARKVPPKQSNYGYQNIYRMSGRNATPHQIVNQVMQNPFLTNQHGKMEEIGIGFALGKDGGTYCVVILASGSL